MNIRRIGIIFHGIGTPERTLEPGEEPYWISIERFESMLDVIAEDPERYRITFDDGNFSDHAIALPRLLARELQAEFFVLTGRINQPGSLGSREITELLAAGMGIGSHGVAHRDWRRLDKNALRVELEESKIVLEELCGELITKAGIPFGGWNASVLKALRQAGYESAWSSDGGCMRSDAFLRPRRSVRGDMDEKALEDLLSGRMSSVRRLRRGLRMALRRLI
ncbi:polysaccharide deacetylase family protein [Kordiimonas sp.]|uniref:polysaccharide deacetylase family protein n=1 Tax=Kordiimonas sp. TaxID=1970157 RepID=UPI003A8D2E6E